MREVGKVKTSKHDAHAKQLPTEQLQVGSPEAFVELVRMYSSQLYQVSLRILRNHADAEDNLQNVLFKAYGKIQRFEGRSHISTWLVSIAINEALMQIRSRRTQLLAMDLQKLEGADGMPIEVSDGHPNPERCYIAKELVAKAFAGLPPSELDLFIRNKGEGWTQRELARENGITISSVKSRIFKARGRMQRLLRRSVDPKRKEAAAQNRGNFSEYAWNRARPFPF
jgi:RNA polymerase sigma factor (sigma-70 family)